MKSQSLVVMSSLLLLSTLLGSLEGYKPVIIVHGMLDGAKEMHFLRGMIEKAHPGTILTVPDVYSYYSSLGKLWNQYPDWYKALHDAMSKAKNGTNLICYSQGGLMCRAILEKMDDHNVENLILLSSPQMGQFGDTSYVPVLPNSRYEVYRVCYDTFFGQDISVCEYWNDPYHQPEYIRSSDFLAVMNNQSAQNESVEWRKNFLKLKNVVMLGGPDDGVITPWQSSHFATYDKELNIVEMKEQEVYIHDYFGLKTLDSRGSLHQFGIAGVNHTWWHRNQTVFDCCILPWLT
ncbi:lysosomal thioesterase PPT2-like [Diadema antillarum]|uniref:lysosomal thioesterase PPT2-like n=1 Tax=Diadema antillarum TaxID=105358 RepID=UPI003A879639